MTDENAAQSSIAAPEPGERLTGAQASQDRLSLLGRRRSTANSAFLVAEGEGVSTVGEKTVRWEKYDVFTMPACQWTSHKAGPGGAKLFQVTDREVLRRLNLLREESKA